MRQTPDKMQELIMRLKGKVNWRSLVITLSAIVVFVTTYLLILPAITLDKDEAIRQGGTDIAVEQTVDDPAGDPGEAVDGQAEEDADVQTVQDDAEQPAEETGGESDEPADPEGPAETASEDSAGEPEIIPVEKAETPAAERDEIGLLTGSKELTADTEESAGFTVSAVVGEANNVPADVSLQASELTKDTEGFDYDEHYDEALKALKKDDSKVEKIKMIRFYDISLESDTQDESVEPNDKVSVKIEYENGIRVSDADNIRIVHFGDKKTEVLDAEDNKVEATVDEKNKLTEASFETDGFSEYAVAEVETIDKYVLSSDGHNYHISVTYAPDAGIPEGADLAVEEITEGSSVNGKSYEEYVAETEKTLGWENGTASFARVFDISIEKDGKKVQPAEGKTVDVHIELADAGKEKELNVVHFKDGSNKCDVMESATDGKAVSFEAGSFSAYAIVQGPSAVELGWTKVASVDDLDETGFYIGSTQGYYFMGEVVADNNGRIGIKKTSYAYNPPTGGGPEQDAVLYYFEKVPNTEDQFYIYCKDGAQKKYVIANKSTRSLYFGDDANKYAFKVIKNNDGSFYIQTEAPIWYWNMQGGTGGNRFCIWNTGNDNNSKLYIWNQHSDVVEDPYSLDNASYGLMYWDSSLYGKAVMAESSTANRLDAKALMVLATADNNSQLFVPNDSDISMWTFKWISDDLYYLTATVDGSKKYLKIKSGGLSLVSSEAEASQIQIVPGTGIHEGEICLKVNGTTMTYSGTAAGGFTVGGSTGSEWLKMVNLAELTSDYYKTYSASKISVSDENVKTGSKVIVYTRVWNEETLKYEYYAINHDGTLVRCYESGDSIEWVGSVINTMLWQFTEYTNDDGTPSFYYELHNEYADNYLAPQVTDGQIIADDPIGINMNGRRNGQYYSTILAWDDENYTYAGLKVENGKIVSCPKLDVMDFYFAVMEEIPVDGTLSTVDTVDHTKYGITMKIVDFNGRTHNGSGATSTDEQRDVIGSTVYTNWKHQPGLLSTNLMDNGYPTATATNKSLSTLFTRAREVNHLFIQSTYDATGYYEFDSSQNFASLKGAEGGDYTDDFDGNFKVYKELGSYDASNKDTLKHGQFLPFNDIEAGRFTSVNKQNLFSTTGEPLQDGDPRKYENLYLVKNKADLYFGVELKASFTQTPNGLDDWGHDIVFEFTGDDDFWLYVDGELVIDLGGIHSAIPGSVNFRTGEVKVNGENHTLRELFENNFITRYKDEHDGAEPSAEEIETFMAQYFDEGSQIFRDYSTHTMNIFYMERGGGASNLHMRFNLASVKPGTVELSKELTGVDSTESTLAEFPYQIKYKRKNDNTEYYLSNEPDNYVFYKNTTNPVTYKSSISIGNTDYNDVFILKPGETVVINFPTFDNGNEEIESYSIVECGVNNEVYNSVKVNGVELSGEAGGDENHSDYAIDYKTTEDRQRVNYENTVDPAALRNLTFRKKLYEPDGETPVEGDSTTFSFRLYLGTESDPELAAANMYTYHVLDPEGNYCKWDAGSKVFVSLGKTDYSNLSHEEKVSASFSTSMNGSISKIPVDYMIEVREVLAGTKYEIQERPNEIPDGYSFQKYVFYEDFPVEEGVNATATYSGGNTVAMAGVVSTIETQKDPHIDICNLKGFGLRVYKVWTDKDYMSERETTYFAIYSDKQNGNEHGQGLGQEKLVPGTLRALPYGASTLYWYWLTLPVEGVPFDDYEIREVEIKNGTPEFDKDGVAINESSLQIHWVRDGSTLSLVGKQKGESKPSSLPYTVHYERGTISENTNVRVDTVTNDRPGIILKKQDWSSEPQPLAGAVFTLTEASSGTLIGTFTSDADGNITTAFLGEGKEYTLTEMSAPQSYHGLEEPLTIKAEDGTVTVNGSEAYSGDDYYILTQAHTDHGTTTPATLAIKDRPYILQAIKQDGDTQAKLAGVHFELHKQVTVDGVTSFDLVPMEGYGDLVTDADGVIPKIDNTLPEGTYQLQEKAALSGYQALPGYIEFTVSKTGAVSLLPSMSDADWVVLSDSTDSTDDSGTLTYTLNILNYINSFVTIKKVDDKNTALTGSKFSLCKYGTTWEAVSGYEEIDLTEATQITLEKLSAGRYRLTETKSPDGYVILSNNIYFNIEQNGSAVFTDESGTGEASYDGTATLSGNVITVINTPGNALPNTGGQGTGIFYILGGILVLGCGIVLIARRRMNIHK